ncbi:MAG: type II toxin-antitoxin system Phd/YefM family antitoxin [Candidatus Aminicenantes bacterium]|nr:type II toxin-antitoxin system Phd/YefM family antitoxin [Candidatus Aminicenantes bacterium]
MIYYSDTLPLSEAKAHLSDLLRRVREEHSSFAITHRGKIEGVLLSINELEGLIETVEILSDRDLLAGIDRGLKDEKAGRLHTHEEVFPDK